MIEIIREVLKELGVTQWRINEKTEETAELFFIRRRLDMRRMKEVTKYSVTVFRDFEKNGVAMKGFSAVQIVPAQSREEIAALLKNAFFAASFVANKTYTLPEKQVCDPIGVKSDLRDISVEDGALSMAEALFEGEDRVHNGAAINSAEIFAVKTLHHIYTDRGTDVSFADYTLDGEFVAQCKTPEDVEMHHSFAYAALERDALRKKAELALTTVADRAVARPELPSGTYDVILSDEQLVTLLSYYGARTSAAMVYPGFSTWKVGEDTQENAKGERLNIIGRAKEPFSPEGIPMTDRTLIADGRVTALHGGARFSSYLNIPALGDYEAIRCENGTVDFEQMKKAPCLYPVCFSDFQMDEMSGHFGGEIRLAYYYDGKEMHIVTGGSVNGSINEVSDDLVFSKERYTTEDYDGPFAVRLKGVKVAGTR